MTRHHDGYQREYWGRILCGHPVDWSVPFVVDLLGDYVFQILRMLNNNLGEAWESPMRRLSEENVEFQERLNHRILNYWNEHYRWYPPNIRRLRDYPAFAASCRLGLWDKNVAKRTLKRQG